MRQAELHLELAAPAAMRGAIASEETIRSACAVLRGSREEARTGSIIRIEGKGESGMENQATTVSFVIPGMPVGKGRPKFARRGNFVSTYTPEKTASYENLVKVKAEEAMQGCSLFDGAVSVEIWLFVTPPASWSQKKQRAALDGGIFPTSKPDVDNVIKGIFDAMNEIVWKDDKQACDLRVVKRYSHLACANVFVRAL
jgi:Holliday junction resolvase RusA-like endonuclease